MQRKTLLIFRCILFVWREKRYCCRGWLPCCEVCCKVGYPVARSVLACVVRNYIIGAAVSAKFFILMQSFRFRSGRALHPAALGFR